MTFYLYGFFLLFRGSALSEVSRLIFDHLCMSMSGYSQIPEKRYHFRIKRGLFGLSNINNI